MCEKELILHELSAHYHGNASQILRNVSLSLKPGQIIGIVGESGCGKTSLLKAIISPELHGIIVDSGSILYSGSELLGLSRAERRTILGNEIGMIVQDSISSLNPIKKIGTQICELLREKRHLAKAEALRQGSEMLFRMGCPPDTMKKYPFQMSGGQRQRALIAMALLLQPGVLLADEPTTALDVTVQAQILKEIRSLADNYGTAVLLITHNFGVVAGIADDIAVMYRGEIVEFGRTEEILHQPRHPYTQALLQCIPDLHQDRSKQLYRIPDAPEKVSACRFAPRCEYCREECLHTAPPLQAGKGAWVLCHRS